VTSGEVFRFGPFEFDGRSKQLLRGGEVVPLSSRHLELLHVLVARAGHIVSKDHLIEAAWPDVAVTDNSVEHAISAIRRVLGQTADTPYIETLARRGYRFMATVTAVERRESDAALEALLAPHRAWIEGRAMLETLARDQIQPARRVFEDVLRHVPNQASAHVGLANACAMQFETTRADAPDLETLGLAVHHAREACRLDPAYGEAWATLGFVLDRSGNHRDAPAASRRAITLEPGNWRHHLRLASVSWGEERLRAAHRTLALLPGCSLAHWLAATVYVARGTFDEAERELIAGLDAASTVAEGPRFSAVGLHWLRGLILLARDQPDAAASEFQRELAGEAHGHLYAREVCAHAWYAIGAVRLQRGDGDAAATAFREALTRVPRHPAARAALNATAPAARATTASDPRERARDAHGADALLARAAELVLMERHADAAALVEVVLNEAPPGSTGWTIPVEPLLDVHRAPETWALVLARLRNRAA
jgi:DNA-binding winged helix-turn-helix (wHTH) protein/cytochrome c-type biogenesis protein CcmH/NrfG